MSGDSSVVRPFSSEWLVFFKDPRDLWQENWFALTLEIVNLAILILVLRHAKRRGNESFYVMLAAVISVICFETLPLWRPKGYTLWWYHQGLVNVLNRRLPSYIVTSFAIVHYVAHNLTRKCNLPVYTRSLATAVTAILMYFPYIWLAPRLLLSLVYFDDPVFKDKLLDVPYIQIIVVFLLFFHTTQLSLENYDALEPQDRNAYNFLWCSILSGSVAAIYTIVEQYLLYLLFTLILKQNIGLCCLAALCVTASVAKVELQSLQKKSFAFTGAFQPLKSTLFWAAFALLLFPSTLPLWLNTRNLRSSGNRLELGPCYVTHEVSNTSPLDIRRRRYICQDDEMHLNFDFHCVDKVALQFAAKNNVNNYTVCGKAFDNPHNLATVISIYSAICLCLIYILMRFHLTIRRKRKKYEQFCSKVQ
ncbi:uncharacterized protein CEXT_600561 [Caerostris extrusa]|uniref:DUF7802 domain-containing protein n=1 Tax=Caerostris extrusa TaxID=172846 RepID=A0AAV4WRS9_CAEEX|nr:uncharacterized protein CEXT_600561 [Caerostris extrusa]